MNSDEPALRVKGVSKRFPGVLALKDVNLELRGGEVHAVCGENGAGKSTLMKILAGSLRPDAGEIYHQGSAIELTSPLEARRRGILLVHQEISLVPELTVAENIFLGNLPTRFGWLFDRRKLFRNARSLLSDSGYALDPYAIVGELSIAEQQMVELARAFAFRCSVVIFDEPTASLTDAEAETLFNNIARLKSQGVAIVYISHKMKEIFRLADRVTVLRDGEHRGTVDIGSMDEDGITRLMIGRSFARDLDHLRPTLGSEVLRVEGIGVRGHVDSASFAICAGEVVGLYGLVGAGRSELVEAIFGLRPITAGAIYWHGRRTRIPSARQAVELGIGLVPEDRKRQGLVLDMSVKGNMSLAALQRVAPGGFLRSSLELKLYEEYASKLNLRAGGPKVRVGTLSGGNQQKTALAKWLATQPQLLILDEPTRGIDVGAKAEVHALIGTLAQQGMAVLLISSEMPEILGMSHRVLTMCKGTITGNFPTSGLTEDRILEHVMQRDS